MTTDHNESIVDIDQERLDEEWIRQPKLALHWGEELAKARHKVSELKAALDVTTAELDKEIRAAPEEHELGKVTETTVANTVLLQPEHQKALRDLNKAKYELDMVQAVVNALGDKKYALQDLVQLWNQSYFATPKAPNEETRERISTTEKKLIRSKGKKRSNNAR